MVCRIVHTLYKVRLFGKMTGRHQDLYFPVLLAKVIGLRLECIMVDVLHTVDLGVAAHVVGKVLWLLAVIHCVFGGITTADKIKRCFDDMKAGARRTRCKNFLQGELTEPRVRTSGQWPKLKAKAAHVRHLSRYALDLVLRFGAVAEDHSLVLSVVQMLVRFYDILDAGSMFLEQRVATEIAELGAGLCKVYSELSARALANNKKM